MPVTVLDITANKFIEAYGKQLKAEGKFTQPDWTIFVKTGVSRQFSPENPDWFFIRGAAILRRLYCQGESGIRDIKRYFGRAKDGCSVQNHFHTGSGAIIHKILHQFEKQGLVEIVANEGRKLSDKGRKTLDQFASQIK